MVCGQKLEEIGERAEANAENRIIDLRRGPPARLSTTKRRGEAA